MAEQATQRPTRAHRHLLRCASRRIRDDGAERNINSDARIGQLLHDARWNIVPSRGSRLLNKPQSAVSLFSCGLTILQEKRISQHAGKRTCRAVRHAPHPNHYTVVTITAARMPREDSLSESRLAFAATEASETWLARSDLCNCFIRDRSWLDCSRLSFWWRTNLRCSLCLSS